MAATLMLTAWAIAPARAADRAGDSADGQFAQDFQRIAPHPAPIDHPPPTIVAPPETPAAGAGNNAVLLPALKGLRLVSRAGDIVRSGVTVAGVTVVDMQGALASRRADLVARVTPFLGKALRMGDLALIKRAIVAWYSAHGRPAVDVVFPEQDISSGTLQAVVMEFHVGVVTTEGNRWYSRETLLSEFGVHPGDPIEAQALSSGVASINDNPFRQADLMMEKGAAPGTTDLHLMMKDRFPLRVYGGYDNLGVRALGRDRWNTGFNWGNDWLFDQLISYQFMASDQAIHGHQPKFMAHSITDDIPLPWRHKLTIFGSFDRETPALPGFEQVGHSGQVSARYTVPLPLFGALPFGIAPAEQKAIVGYDFKTTNNNLQFGGSLVSNTATEIDQFLFGYSLALDDPWGRAFIDNSFVVSPGGMTALNNSAAFQASRASARADYFYDNLTLRHDTSLPWGFVWGLKVVGQLSNHNLLPSEQVTAGGVETVRGYEEHQANGDEGVVVNNELRAPPFSALAKLLPPSFPEQTQLLAFWDYAAVRPHQKVAGDAANVAVHESSVGLGLRYGVATNLAVKLDYGWQLQRLSGQTAHGQFGYVSVTVGY